MLEKQFGGGGVQYSTYRVEFRVKLFFFNFLTICVTASVSGSAMSS